MLTVFLVSCELLSRTPAADRAGGDLLWAAVNAAAATDGGYRFHQSRGTPSFYASYYFAATLGLQDEGLVQLAESYLQQVTAIGDQFKLQEVFFAARIVKRAGRQLHIPAPLIMQMSALEQPDGSYRLPSERSLGEKLITTQRILWLLANTGNGVRPQTVDWLTAVWLRETEDRFDEKYHTTYLQTLAECLKLAGVDVQRLPRYEETVLRLRHNLNLLEADFQSDDDHEPFTLLGVYGALDQLGSSVTISDKMREEFSAYRAQDGLYNLLGRDLPVGEPQSTWLVSIIVGTSVPRTAVTRYVLSDGAFQLPATISGSIEDTYRALIVARQTGHLDDYRQHVMPYLRQVVVEYKKNPKKLSAKEVVLLKRLTDVLAPEFSPGLSARFDVGVSDTLSREELDDLHAVLVLAHGRVDSKASETIRKKIAHVYRTDGGYGTNGASDIRETVLAIEILKGVGAKVPAGSLRYLLDHLETSDQRSPQTIFYLYRLSELLGVRSRKVDDLLAGIRFQKSILADDAYYIAAITDEGGFSP